jgi:fungal STAND N-terminal Goodbye domain
MEAALVDYKKDTGIDLSKTPFAAALEQSNSPEAILQLLHDREIAFKEYREGNRILINCLGQVVKAIHALSGIIGEAVSLVSLTSSSGDSLSVTSSDPLPTSKGYICCY